MPDLDPLPAARPMDGIAIVRPAAELFAPSAAAVAEFGGAHVNRAGLQAPVTPDRASLDDLKLIEEAAPWPT